MKVGYHYPNASVRIFGLPAAEWVIYALQMIENNLNIV